MPRVNARRDLFEGNYVSNSNLSSIDVFIKISKETLQQHTKRGDKTRQITCNPQNLPLWFPDQLEFAHLVSQPGLCGSELRNQSWMNVLTVCVCLTWTPVLWLTPSSMSAQTWLSVNFFASVLVTLSLS